MSNCKDCETKLNSFNKNCYFCGGDLCRSCIINGTINSLQWCRECDKKICIDLCKSNVCKDCEKKKALECVCCFCGKDVCESCIIDGTFNCLQWCNECNNNVCVNCEEYTDLCKDNLCKDCEEKNEHDLVLSL